MSVFLPPLMPILLRPGKPPVFVGLPTLRPVGPAIHIGTGERALPLRSITPPVRDIVISEGPGFVQLICDTPDDARARVAFVSCGVAFHPGCLMAIDGTVYMFKSTQGKYVYRFRS